MDIKHDEGEVMIKYDISKSIASSRTLCMPHQQDAVNALNNYYLMDSPKHPQSGLIVMPTGSGKTFTAVNWLLNTGVAKGYRILWLVHRQELIDQTYSEFENQLGCLSDYNIKTINMMKISGSPDHSKMSQTSRQDIYVCSILSAASKNGRRFIRRMLGTSGAEKLIVKIEEAHHATAPSYVKVLEIIEKINPNRILLGLTATPIRMSEYETKKLNLMFNAMSNKSSKNKEPLKYIYEISISELIKTGFLAKPYYKYINTEIHGDIEYNLTDEDVDYFNSHGELTEFLKKMIASSQSRNQIILDEYINHRKHYSKTLIFAINQLHAELLSRLFKEKGINCDYAISDREDSYYVINDFKNGDIDVLVNVQMLTEGSDVPDIQSVFITRETNSDSLLMQMVGRGLRGVNAGGTKEAYIVSFHDTWDRIQLWMKPEFVTKAYEISDIDYKPSEDTNGIENVVVEDEPKEGTNVNEMAVDAKSINLKDLYEKLYSVMKVNITSEVISDIIPDGWFSVLLEDGSDQNISVYRDQLLGYQELEASIVWLLKSKPSIQTIINNFFKDSHVIPSDSDIKAIVDSILDNNEMPDYYTFEERDRVAPDSIVNEMVAYSNDKDKQMYWLESYYKKHDILKQIYKTFFAFRKSVMDKLEEPYEAEAIYIDDRDEFEIVSEYRNLDNLYKQLIQQYPKLDNLPVNSIYWSKRVVKSWLGICKKLPDETYTIFINRLMSSPLVSEEAIKYVMYHELLHASGLRNHGEKFREEEWKYPNSDELDGELDEMEMKYKIDFKSLKKMRFDEELYSNKVRTHEKVNEESINEKREYKFCRNCGNKLPIDARFCDVCGSSTGNY